MFLSQLLVNQNAHPDQPQPGLAWIRNTYSVHQRLWMAFPDRSRVEEDPFFLGTWSPEKRAKHGRDKEGFLFRIESDFPLRILVQSMAEPNWDYAFRNAGHLLADIPKVRSFEPVFNAGEHFRFRLVMQMVRRRSVPKAAADSVPKRRSEHPIRCVLANDGSAVPGAVDPAFTAWRDVLKTAGEKGGFTVGEYPQALRVSPVTNLRMKSSSPGRPGDRFHAALFEGLLTCVDPDQLKNAVIAGIGRGKAFGMGLLSLATVS